MTVKPVNAATAVAYAHQLGHTISPAILRKWVQRGHLHRPAKDRYDLAEIHHRITGDDPYQPAA